MTGVQTCALPISWSGGLDVKVDGRRVEVQKGSRAAAYWTLKRWEGVLKSRREESV